MNKVSVFLVEDEVVIRTGIEKSIKWEENGFIFAGQASDGEIALPLILKNKPDILITDVKMPFMNGLELSRIVKKELPETKIIILSGYNDFEYAKEAINISVTEYLLKPISAAKLLNTLNEVKNTILAERGEKELIRKYQEEMEENIESAKMKFYRQILFGEVSTAEAIENGKRFNLSLGAGMYAILLFKILPAADNDNPMENSFEVEDNIEEVLKNQDDIYMIQAGVEGWTFLIMGDNEEGLDNKIKEFSNMLHGAMSNYPKLEYFGGIGRKVVRVRELKKSYRDADKAFIGRFTMKSNKIISLEELENNNENQNMDNSGFANVEHSRELIEKFLYNGTVNELDSFTELYMEEFSKDAFKTELMRQYLIMDIYITIMSFCEKTGISNKEFASEAEKIHNKMQRQQSVRELQANLRELLDKSIGVRDSVSARKYSDIIKTAQDMIMQNYMQEDISLNSVAEIVDMSPSYFSSVFSKEVGKTFVEYLTEIRMDKAKELLMCTSMKTSDIGHRVGYKDSHYFSFIFKKKQGCSPKEYRARKRAE